MTTTTTEPINTVDPTLDELTALLQLQRSAHRDAGPATAALRRNRMDRLALAVLEHADELAAAISDDFGQRPIAMSLSTDVLGSLQDLEDLRTNVESWMQPQQLTEDGSAFVQQHPLGVIAVIGAWNFPVTLTVQPAMAAIAAGNRVIIKMPSTDPRTSEVLRRAIAEQFTQDEVAVVTGDGKVNDDFVSLPFDHIMFTGSPRVGSIVQAAAAKNLVPVTLELGGKNPMVIDADADLDLAADHVVVSKMANGGQICMCGDYALVDNTVKDAFVEKLTQRLRGYFPTYADNPNVVTLVNDSAFRRITGLIDDAVAKGAIKVEIVNDHDAAVLPDAVRRIVAPTILLDVPDDAEINDDEIFGPVLPVYGYDAPQDAVDFVNANPAPLAAYWYGPDNDNFQRFCDLTTSGGVTRNDGFLHAGIHGAPFGGVGRSGHGAYHGKVGFDTFTHRRPIASAQSEQASLAHFVGPAVTSPQLVDGLSRAVAGALQMTRGRVAEYVA